MQKMEEEGIKTLNKNVENADELEIMEEDDYES